MRHFFRLKSTFCIYMHRKGPWQTLSDALGKITGCEYRRVSKKKNRYFSQEFPETKRESQKEVNFVFNIHQVDTNMTQENGNVCWMRNKVLMSKTKNLRKNKEAVQKYRKETGKQTCFRLLPTGSKRSSMNKITKKSSFASPWEHNYFTVTPNMEPTQNSKVTSLKKVNFSLNSRIHMPIMKTC